MKNQKERLEDLQYKGLKICQNKDLYCFTSDAVTLANFAKIKRGDKVCDFCSGSGIIAILISAKNEPSEIYAVEIQDEMFELLQKMIQMLQRRIGLVKRVTSRKSNTFNIFR